MTETKGPWFPQPDPAAMSDADWLSSVFNRPRSRGLLTLNESALRLPQLINKIRAIDDLKAVIHELSKRGEVAQVVDMLVQRLSTLPSAPELFQGLRTCRMSSEHPNMSAGSPPQEGRD